MSFLRIRFKRRLSRQYESLGRMYDLLSYNNDWYVVRMALYFIRMMQQHVFVHLL